MSRANAQIRFPDGLILFGLYNGYTINSDLFDDQAEAWDFYDHGRVIHEEAQCPHHNEEKVVVATDYGPGFYWEAYACRHCRRVVDGEDPHRRPRREFEGIMAAHEALNDGWYSPPDDYQMTDDGLPDWWLKP